MQTTPGTIPKIAIQSIAGGLLLMAFFTILWATLAAGSLSGMARYGILTIFVIFSITFVVNSFRLFKAAKHFSAVMTADDKAEGKNMGIWYGIIFGAEGVIIPIVVFILIHFQQAKLIIPAIALIVGLHFYPMAKVFRRTIDYYLATWTSLAAIAAIIMTINNTTQQATIFVFLGISVALATSSYGLYMIYEGKRMTGGL